MAFEILNSANITPHRLHAMVRLVSRLSKPKREDILNLLQPESLARNQETAKSVYNAARHCLFITEDNDNQVKLLVEPEQVESVQGFRQHMQCVLTGITDEQEKNHLLNIYVAWYAVQEEQVFICNRKDLETKFNTQIYPTDEERQFNTTKFNGWRTWAAFVGWGRLMKIRTFDILMPDATVRIKAILDKVLPQADEIGEFGVFAQRLADICPELDGGKLFEYCWQLSRGAEQRGNRLSLMLSTALRTLHTHNHIELIRQPDATDLWQLYPATGKIREVSHIQRRSA